MRKRSGQYSGQPAAKLRTIAGIVGFLTTATPTRTWVLVINVRFSRWTDTVIPRFFHPAIAQFYSG